MKKTTIVGLGLILVLALVATVALAWGPGFGRSFGGPAYGAPSILNLTTDILLSPSSATFIPILSRKWQRPFWIDS